MALVLNGGGALVFADTPSCVLYACLSVCLSAALFSPLETEQYPVKPAVAALANRRPNGPVG